MNAWELTIAMMNGYQHYPTRTGGHDRFGVAKSVAFTATFSVCVLLVGVSFAAAGEPIAPKHAALDSAGALAWYDVSHLELEGKGWAETKSRYDRLPPRAEQMVRRKVWDLSRQSAGMCLRFVTDATQLHARWTLTSDRLASPRMTATCASGLDLYVKMGQGEWRWLGVGMPTKQTNTVVLTSGIPQATREFLLYLPLFNGVASLEIGIPKEAQLLTAVPWPGDRKPLLFYGTSITHGSSASRPGMCHTAILGRQLDRPVLNLGFSGNGKMEPELADLLAELDPAVFVLDCLPNMDASEVTQRTEPFVQRLRQSRPDTPILLVEDRTYANSFLVTSRRERNVTNRQAYRQAYERLQAAGVEHLYYLEGERLLGSDGEATIDSSHPTDLGFMRQARVFREMLTQILPHASVSIHRTVIEQAREEVPRADTASVVELSPGRLMMVYHRYRASEHAGSDFGPCTIWAQTSQDGGRTWSGTREIVAARDGDINVQAPALCRLPDGELLLLANRAHGKSSTTMELHRSRDDGQTWQFAQTLWEKSDGQWLQGGNSQLLLLESGRLVFGLHGGTGTQGKQKNDAWCMMSDDKGNTWHAGEVIARDGDLTKNPSETVVLELSDGRVMAHIRNESPQYRRAMSISPDGATGWTTPRHEEQLYDPICQASLARYSPSQLLFSNPDSSRTKDTALKWNARRRENLTIRLSNDDGKTWPVSKVLEPGFSGYSQLAVIVFSPPRSLVPT